MSSRSYILQIRLWHQSLKSIHYRTLCIFQNKKKQQICESKHGGDKRHVIPPMSKHGGDISPPSPPGFTPLFVYWLIIVFIIILICFILYYILYMYHCHIVYCITMCE